MNTLTYLNSREFQASQKEVNLCYIIIRFLSDKFEDKCSNEDIFDELVMLLLAVTF